MATISILWVASVAFTVNIPLGSWRQKYKKFSFPWWLLIHLSIPIIVVLRIWHNIPNIYIPLFILTAIIGQLIGKRITEERIK